jgi:GNAT superfamily N-acetyltransferase
VSLSTELSRSLDLHEARAWGAMYRYLPLEAVALAGSGIATIGSAVVAHASKVDVLGYNRAVGLGLDGPATEEQIDEIISHFAGHDVPRFFVQLHPEAEPAALPQWLEARGFTNWVRLYRDARALEVPEGGPRVEQIGTERADAFGHIVVRAFEWPEALAPFVTCLIGRPGWRHYLAYEGDTPIGTATLHADGEIGWFGFAATVAEFRGRGAQTALIARRIADAREAGCKHLIVETAQQTPEKEAPSYRNIRRSGFEVAYLRPNYFYQFSDY